MILVKLLKTIGVALLAVVVILNFTYDFDLSWIHVSNAFFLVGILCFFSGIITATHALDLFYSIRYLTGKIFSGASANDFKSYGAYREYRALNRTEKGRRQYGILLITGLIYLTLSFIMSMVWGV